MTAPSRAHLALATVSAFAVSACTFETGEGFATLVSAGLTVYSPTAFVNARGERATFVKLELDCAALKLMPAGSSAQTGTPGTLPPDDGHGHRVLAGPTTTDPTLLTLPISTRVSAMVAARLELNQTAPSPQLVKGPIGSARLECRRIQGTGYIEANWDEPIPFMVDVAFTAPFEFKLPSLPVDRTIPDELTLEASLFLDRAWFNLDFQKLLGVEIVLNIDERYPLSVTLVQLGLTPSQLSIAFSSE